MRTTKQAKDRFEVIFVGDQDSYKTIWFNGVKEFDSSDSIMIEDVLHSIAERVNVYDGIDSMVVETFSLKGDAITSDIPKDVNTVEALREWHLNTYGTEIENGW